MIRNKVSTLQFIFYADMPGVSHLMCIPVQSEFYALVIFMLKGFRISASLGIRRNFSEFQIVLSCVVQALEPFLLTCGVSFWSRRCCCYPKIGQFWRFFLLFFSRQNRFCPKWNGTPNCRNGELQRTYFESIQLQLRQPAVCNKYHS